MLLFSNITSSTIGTWFFHTSVPTLGANEARSSNLLFVLDRKDSLGRGDLSGLSNDFGAAQAVQSFLGTSMGCSSSCLEEQFPQLLIRTALS